MAPIIPTQTPTPPDPPDTTWGKWEKRVNWLLTILLTVGATALAVYEATRAPGVVPATAPATLPAPAPDVVPVHVDAPDVPAVTPLGAVGAVLSLLPVACGPEWAAVRHDLAVAGLSIADCLARCELRAVVDDSTRSIAIMSRDGYADLGAQSVTCATSCGASVGLSAVTELAHDLFAKVGALTLCSASVAPTEPPACTVPRYRMRLVVRGPETDDEVKTAAGE